LSKLIKSKKCLSSLPYQLEPVDVDAFFISDDAGEDFDWSSSDSELQSAVHPAGQVAKSSEEIALELVADAQQSAEQILSEARAQASLLVEKAKQEAVGLKEKAQQTGREQGLADSKTKWAQHLTTALALLASAEEEHRQRILASEAELLGLAVAIAEKIIGTALQLDPAIQLQLVKTALAQVATASVITMKINPEDGPWFKENVTQLEAWFKEPKQIEINEDASIARGNIYLQTEHGNVDSRIKSQLELIMNELLKVGQLT
jgi:flagellar assembly protein FliH